MQIALAMAATMAINLVIASTISASYWRRTLKEASTDDLYRSAINRHRRGDIDSAISLDVRKINGGIEQ
jgi:hypothetical protein